jgi:aminopeptidase N
MISIGAEAVENWGLISYAGLLDTNPKVAMASLRYKAVSTICRETAHQWFGNLVTPASWGVEFVSEGFANFYAHRALPKDVEEGYMVTYAD